MQRHILILVLCIVLGCIQISSADYPDMIGTWFSDDGLVYFLDDTIEEASNFEDIWVFDMQKDHVISGLKTFFMPGGTTVNETLVGIFDPDGKTISFIDQSGGWAKGTFIDSDTLFIALLTPGDNSMKADTTMALTMTLHRQENV